MGKGTKYDRLFKIETAQMILNGEKTVDELAKTLDIASKTIYRWSREYRCLGEDAFCGSGNLKSSDQDIKRMHQKIKDLEEENAILKKAAAIFVRKPR